MDKSSIFLGNILEDIQERASVEKLRTRQWVLHYRRPGQVPRHGGPGLNHGG